MSVVIHAPRNHNISNSGDISTSDVEYKDNSIKTTGYVDASQKGIPEIKFRDEWYGIYGSSSFTLNKYSITGNGSSPSFTETKVSGLSIAKNRYSNIISIQDHLVWVGNWQTYNRRLTLSIYDGISTTQASFTLPTAAISNYSSGYTWIYPMNPERTKCIVFMNSTNAAILDISDINNITVINVLCAFRGIESLLSHRLIGMAFLSESHQVLACEYGYYQSSSESFKPWVLYEVRNQYSEDYSSTSTTLTELYKSTSTSSEVISTGSSTSSPVYRGWNMLSIRPIQENYSDIMLVEYTTNNVGSQYANSPKILGLVRAKGNIKNDNFTVTPISTGQLEVSDDHWDKLANIVDVTIGLENNPPFLAIKTWTYGQRYGEVGMLNADYGARIYALNPDYFSITQGSGGGNAIEPVLDIVV